MNCNYCSLTIRNAWLFGIRYFRGLVESIDEPLLAFVGVWCLCAPFVVFQALVSAREDNAGRGGGPLHLTHLETVIPLMFVLSILLLVVGIACVLMVTPYEVCNLSCFTAYNSPHCVRPFSSPLRFY